MTRSIFSYYDTTPVQPGCGDEVLVPARSCELSLPRQHILAADARSAVRDLSTHLSVRDAAWRAIISRARRDPGLWHPVAIWAAIPTLKWTATRLYRHWGGDLEDLRSEAILAFLQETRAMKLDNRAIGTRLKWSIYTKVRNANAHLYRERPVENIDLTQARPVIPDPQFDIPALAGRRPRSTAATLRAVHGERLGELAQHYGLAARLNHRHDTGSGDAA
ncbi:hypothetical protein BJF85_14620 [Saccharomonospora sp. CUA-673]|uniref:hypothetical protein n=1 Tax=Saccharomonospora sp. CUA-673 TaxID=1904969 RepID=UPI000963D04C|nr:hypothetical protein [Saccharomonospora sp. CUA-673]OLT47857.1 hypothetical protein BJF85_14620 [Saccharomonospora sp. CUA-673]